MDRTHYTGSTFDHRYLQSRMACCLLGHSPDHRQLLI